MISNLREKCEEYLTSNLKPENLYDIAKVAERFDRLPLLESILQFGQEFLSRTEKSDSNLYSIISETIQSLEKKCVQKSINLEKLSQS